MSLYLRGCPCLVCAVPGVPVMGCAGFSAHVIESARMESGKAVAQFRLCENTNACTHSCPNGTTGSSSEKSWRSQQSPPFFQVAAQNLTVLCLHRTFAKTNDTHQRLLFEAFGERANRLRVAFPVPLQSQVPLSENRKGTV